MDETPQSKSKIVVLAVVLLLAVAAAIWFVKLNPRAVSPPVGSNTPSATNVAPIPAPNRIIGGVVISVALSDKKIVIGSYRVENNKAVLASQSTVYYTSATVFSREARSQSGSSAENKISPQDIKVGEAAMIVVSGASPVDHLVAERVAFLLPPLPPRNRK